MNQNLDATFDRAKLALNRSQSLFAKWPKNWSPFGWLERRIFMDFGSQLAPQDGKEIFSFWSMFGSWGPLGSKMASRWPQEASRGPKTASKTHFGAILEAFWGHFGATLGPFGATQGLIFDQFLIDFSYCFNWFVCWSVGLLLYCVVVLMVCWCVCFLVCLFVGCCFVGCLNQWTQARGRRGRRQLDNM